MPDNKSFWFILFLLNIWTGILPAQTDSLATSDSVSVDSSAQNTGFVIGEKLTFKLRYGFITAGYAEMMAGREIYKDSVDAYHFQTKARSAGGFSWIFKVKDVVNSYINPVDFTSIYFEKKLREGSYRADLLTNYLHRDSLAIVKYIRYKSNMKVRTKTTYRVKVPPDVQDILSSFYYIRTQNLEVGKSIFLTNHEKKKVYPLEIRVYKKETVEVKAGKFRCLVIEPLIKGEGLFNKKGRLRVWLTDDKYKIPVQMTTEVVVGHITSELIKIEGIPTPIPAQLP